MKVLSQLAVFFAALLAPLASPAQQLFTKPLASDLPMGGHNIVNAGTVSATTFNGALAWPNLTGTPTTLAGYGITDPVVTTGGVYNNPAWLASISSAKITAGAGASWMFEGDSITYGQYLSSPSTQCFQAVFAGLSFAHGYSAMRNDGVSGSGISDVQSRYAANVKPHRPAANGGDGGPAAYLVLMIGINDLQNGGAASTEISAISSYTAQAQTDGFTVVLATVLPSGFNGNWSPAMTTQLQALNEAIRTLQIPCNLIWDANAVLTDPTDANVWRSDEIHPLADGHQALAYSLNSQLTAGGSLYGAPAAFGNNFKTSGTVTANGGVFGLSQSIFSATGETTSTFPLVTQATSTSGYSFLAFNDTTGTPRGFVGYGNSGTGNIYTGAVCMGSKNGTQPLVFAVNDTEEGQFSSGGNFLLGTSADDGVDKLQVNGSSSFVTPFSNSPWPVSVESTSASGYALMAFKDNAGAVQGFIGFGNSASLYPSEMFVGLAGGTSYPLVFLSDGLAKAELSSAGNFLIGTTADDGAHNLQVSGGIATVTAGATVAIKSGTNALAGTVTLSSGAATLTSSAIDANTVIVLSLKTSGGTPGASTPRTSVGSGSATVAGLSTDNSTYNWVAFKVN